MALSYTLTFTEAELQAKLDKLMPLKRKQLFVNIVITEPKLDLIEGANALSILANVQAFAPAGLKGQGKTHIKGTIDYRPEQGEFYLQNPQIIALEIAGVPVQYQKQIKQLAQTTISKALLSQPVYTLKDSDVNEQLAKSTLESVEVKSGKLLVNFSMF